MIAVLVVLVLVMTRKILFFETYHLFQSADSNNNRQERYIQKLTSKHSHLYLYRVEDALLVYSSFSYNLYAFEKVSATLFLMLERGEATSPLTDNANPTLGFMKNIISAKDNISQETPQTDNFGSAQKAYHLPQGSSLYCLDKWYFSIDSEDAALQKMLHTSLQHLTCPLSDDITVNLFSIRYEKGVYRLFFNQTLQKEVKGRNEVTPSLHGLLRQMYYNSLDFLIAMHAASLTYHDRVLIIPGISGAGKSTLSTYLTQHGFALFSDETTLITRSNEIVPIPLAVAIKEGSWSLFSETFSPLSAYSTHKRFDGQKVKYIPLHTYANKPYGLENTVIVFSRYQEGSELVYEQINIVEALQYIVEAQYHIWDPKNAQVIEQWLALLSSCTLYKMQYSKLQEAEAFIKKVMNEEN